MPKNKGKDANDIFNEAEQADEDEGTYANTFNVVDEAESAFEEAEVPSLKVGLHLTEPEFHMNYIEPTFYNDSGQFVTLKAEGGFYCRNKSGVVVALAAQGLPKDKGKGQKMSKADAFIQSIMSEYKIDAYMTVSGYPVGRWVTKEGKIILTTGSPVIPLASNPATFQGGPLKSICPVIHNIMFNLLVNPDEPDLDQFLVVLYNLANRFNVLHDSLHGPRSIETPVQERSFPVAQAIILCGKSGSGKTLYAEHIHASTIGGGSTDPTSFLLGGTSFNENLVGSSTLLLDDSLMQGDSKDRMTLANNIKKRVAEARFLAHGKGQKAYSIALFHSIICCSNDDASAIKNLPLLDASSADKVHILKAYKAVLPEVQAATPEEIWPAQLAAINAEIPMLRNYLLAKLHLEEFPLPSRLVDPTGRFPSKAYAHPDYVAATTVASEESEVLQVIIQLLSPTAVEWKGSSADLSQKLTTLISNVHASKKPAGEIVELIESPRRLGKCLSLLAATNPETVSSLPLTQGIRKYHIQFPQDDQNPTQDQEIPGVDS